MSRQGICGVEVFQVFYHLLISFYSGEFEKLLGVIALSFQCCGFNEYLASTECSLQFWQHLFLTWLQGKCPDKGLVGEGVARFLPSTPFS